MTGTAGLSRVSRLAAHHYDFSSRWVVSSPPDVTFAVLRQPERYAEWWPEIRSAVQTSEGAGVIELRSAWPFTVRFSLTRENEDPDEGRLEAVIDGDVRGHVQWTVTGAQVGSVVHFNQDVTLRHPVARRLDFALHPLMQRIHHRAMRGGARGLGRHVAASTELVAPSG